MFDSFELHNNPVFQKEVEKIAAESKDLVNKDSLEKQIPKTVTSPINEEEKNDAIGDDILLE